MAEDLVARLAQARVIPPGQLDLLRSPAEVLRDILLAGDGYLARKRTWWFGDVQPDVDVVRARLGYETRETSDAHDASTKGFRPEAIRRGQAVNFVVRLADLTVVYERPRGMMSDQAFVRGFQHVLNSADKPQRWSVALMDTKATFDDWSQHIDVVHRFRFRAQAATLPADHGSPILSALIHPRAERVTIDWRDKEGVDIRDRTLQELVRVAGQGLGEAFAVGRKNGTGSAGEQKAWASANSAERVVREVPVDPEIGEVAAASFLSVLADVPLDNPW